MNRDELENEKCIMNLSQLLFYQTETWYEFHRGFVEVCKVKPDVFLELESKKYESK
jgi:hypothetical protein